MLYGSTKITAVTCRHIHNHKSFYDPHVLETIILVIQHSYIARRRVAFGQAFFSPKLSQIKPSPQTMRGGLFLRATLCQGGICDSALPSCVRLCVVLNLRSKTNVLFLVTNTAILYNLSNIYKLQLDIHMQSANLDMQTLSCCSSLSRTRLRPTIISLLSCLFAIAIVCCWYKVTIIFILFHQYMVATTHTHTHTYIHTYINTYKQI